MSEQFQSSIGPQVASEHESMRTNTAPLVDIIVITFNHEHYVGQALDSVLAQKTSFPVRTTILEDCSTDGTREIVQRYARQHPELRLHLNPANLCSDLPLLELIAGSEAAYVAILEGDDYWTDPLKLEKQVAFLAGNPDCALCYHNVKIVEDGRLKHMKNPPHHPQFSTIHDLFEYNFIATCSVVYRREALDDIPPWYHDTWAGDWYMHLLAARSGRIGYLPDPMGAYRIHDGGIWSGMSPLEQWLYCVQVQEHMRAHFDARYHPDIDRGRVYVLQYLAQMQASLGRAGEALQSLEQASRIAPDTAESPAVLIDVLPRQARVSLNNEEGFWLDLHCASAIPTTFALAGDHSLATEFRSPQHVAAFYPDRLLGKEDASRLRLIDTRGESNELNLKELQ